MSDPWWLLVIGFGAIGAVVFYLIGSNYLDRREREIDELFDREREIDEWGGVEVAWRLPESAMTRRLGDAYFEARNRVRVLDAPYDHESEGDFG